MGREMSALVGSRRRSLTELLGIWRGMIRKADPGIHTKKSESESQRCLTDTQIIGGTESTYAF
jgi:hypothetical protein